jgi:hypothetical protein
MNALARIFAPSALGCEKFSVEALSGVLTPVLVREALQCTGRGSQRRRKLPAEFALWCVVLLGLFRRHSYANLLGMLGESLWAQPVWGGKPPSSSALTQARDRLGIEPLRVLYERSACAFLATSPEVRVGGLRLMSIDGTTARMPDTPANAEHFGYAGASRGRCAYPMMRLVTLADVGSHLAVAERHGPYRTAEMTLARSLLDSVPPNALVMADRGFMAFEFLWDLHQHGCAFGVRLKRGMTFRTLRRLGPGDRIVRVRIPANVRRRRPDMPRCWELREITYRPRPHHEGIRLLLSVLDPLILPGADAASAYGQRWSHETQLDELKTHLLDRATVNRPVCFRSERPDRVEQELYGILVAHNLVRTLMGRSAHLAGRTPLRLSYVLALERIRDACRDMMTLPTHRLRERHGRMLEAIARGVLPIRHRSNPREVKIKMSNYPCKMTRCVA